MHEIDKSLSKYFVSSDSREECYEIFTQACRLGIDFKTGKNTSKSVVNYREQSEIAQRVLEPIPEEPSELSDILREFEENIMDSSQWNVT